ncbi:AraC family transcriptional regulator, positive regulator of tynA and feaB [Hyphomicrobium sp. 1Nfss2.1]|uniref:helix-turn-helix transcriptional regulator n=1 Tax=Hyphomicrobium sp. 1Nfss2.1 TaxID=3413936 RepID=UPI003C7DFB10
MTSAENDFRRTHFKSPETVDKRWLEWFREEFSRRVFRMDFQPDPDVPIRFEGTSRQLPNLAICHGAWSSMRTTPTQKAISEEAIGLSIALKGDLIFRPRDDKLMVAAGAGAFGRPSGLDMRSGATFLYVRLSSSILAPLVPNLADISLASLPANTPALRLLTGYLRMLDAEDSIATPEAGHLVAQHIHDLAAIAVGTHRDAAAVASGRGVRAARLAAIKQDILSNLADQGLSVESVATRHALTPRYIHMLFEAEGVTFSEYVLDQRLTRAHRMLSDPRFAAQSISTIALAVGFGDISYFNRTFRRRFGMTPSDVRQSFRQERG